MPEAAVNVAEGARSRSWRARLRFVAFWSLIIAAVGAAIYSGAASREAAWYTVQAEHAAAEAATVRGASQRRLALEGQELSAVQAENRRLEVALAAAQDASIHLRLDRGAGTLELVRDGLVLRRMQAGESALAVGSHPLDPGAELPVSQADAAAIWGLMTEGGTLHVY